MYKEVKSVKNPSEKKEKYVVELYMGNEYCVRNTETDEIMYHGKKRDCIMYKNNFLNDVKNPAAAPLKVKLKTVDEAIILMDLLTKRQNDIAYKTYIDHIALHPEDKKTVAYKKMTWTHFKRSADMPENHVITFAENIPPYKVKNNTFNDTVFIDGTEREYAMLRNNKRLPKDVEDATKIYYEFKNRMKNPEKYMTERKNPSNKKLHKNPSALSRVIPVMRGMSDKEFEALAVKAGFENQYHDLINHEYKGKKDFARENIVLIAIQNKDFLNRLDKILSEKRNPSTSAPLDTLETDIKRFLASGSEFDYKKALLTQARITRKMGAAATAKLIKPLIKKYKKKLNAVLKHMSPLKRKSVNNPSGKILASVYHNGKKIDDEMLNISEINKMDKLADHEMAGLYIEKSDIGKKFFAYPDDIDSDVGGTSIKYAYAISGSPAPIKLKKKIVNNPGDELYYVEVVHPRKKNHNVIYKNVTVKQLKNMEKKLKVDRAMTMELYNRMYRKNPAPGKSYTGLTKSVDLNKASLYNSGVREMKHLHDSFHHYPATKIEAVEIDLKQDKDGNIPTVKIGTMSEFKYISDKDIDDKGIRKKTQYVHGFRMHLPIYTNGKVLIIPLLNQEITERGFIYKKK